MRLLAVVALSLCLPFTVVVGAEPSIEKAMTADEFRAAGLDKLSAEELSQLNDWLARDRAKIMAIPAPGTNNMATATPAASPTDSGPAIAYRYRKEAGSSEPDHVQSRIVGEFSGWSKGSVFDLENGQRWQVIDASSYSASAKTNPEVRIKKALMGSWLMKVGGGNRTARVERIR